MRHSLRLFITILALASACSLSAQTYNTAFGVRAGNGFDLTLQQYIKNGWTIEPMLHTPLFSNDFGASILAEKHYKILIRNITVYGGAGAHYYARTEANRSERIVNNVAGLSFIGGAELSLGRLNFSIDWKPELRLSGDQVHPFRWNGIAVSGRYIIDKRERRIFRDRDRRDDRWRRDRDNNRDRDRGRNNNDRSWDGRKFRS